MPLSAAAIDILQNLPRVEGVDLIFGVTSNQITDTMKKVRAKARLADIRFHDLRHEATSRFFENTDLDVMEVKAITGHKTLQMLSRYTHLPAGGQIERSEEGRMNGVVAFIIVITCWYQQFITRCFYLFYFV